jgi:hypothetical protein
MPRVDRPALIVVPAKRSTVAEKPRGIFSHTEHRPDDAEMSSGDTEHRPREPEFAPGDTERSFTSHQRAPRDAENHSGEPETHPRKSKIRPDGVTEIPRNIQRRHRQAQKSRSWKGDGVGSMYEMEIPPMTLS